MLAYVIFAATFVIVLILALIYLYPSSKRTTSVPGLEPTSKEDGNLADIQRAGSLHEFLMDLHGEFGAIASFWMGQEMIISIASAELFKQHQNIFDRPAQLFRLFEPMIGPDSIQYQNGAEGRKRRNKYDKCFSYDAVANLYPCFQQVSDELSRKWSTMGPDQHLPLSQHMFALAIKAILLVTVGDAFNDDKEILEFRKNYDICFAEMEHRLTDQPGADSQREKAFQEAKDKLKATIKKIVDKRLKNPPKDEDEYLLIDHIIEVGGSNIEMIYSDMCTYMVGGFHTTGNLLTWALYFLATHEDLQDRAVDEIRDILGSTNVDYNSLGNLMYMRQVIDESMRCAVLAPWAARFQDFDSELGGHKIPKNTPVIHALGVVMQDEAVFPQPEKFDPDRFLPENEKKLPTITFSPFGFAGKRMCPAYRFSYSEVAVILVTLLRKFKVTLVEGQVVTPVYGLVTHPEEEIWITVSKRK